jgi:hypothetical protein
MIGDLPPEDGVAYVAAMDPGFVKNRWTFAIGGQRLVDGAIKRSIVLLREWEGTREAPNKSKSILREIAPICRAYRTSVVWSDQYEHFGLQEMAEEMDVGISIAVVEGGSEAKQSRYEETAMYLCQGLVDLHPEKQLRTDLLNVKRVVSASGITVQEIETPDGRHADYAPTVTTVLSKSVEEPKLTPEQRRAIRPPEVRPGYGTKEAFDADQAEMTAQLERQNGSEAEEFWETLVVDETEEYFGRRR